MITRMKFRIFTNSPYRTLYMTVKWNGHFHILGENPGIQPCYHFYDFSLKNDNLGLKIKNLKFLGIEPTHTIKIFFRRR